MKELRRSLGLSLIGLVTGALGAWGSCVEPIPIMHFRGVGPEAGAFDLSATGYAQKPAEGPVVRFWAHGAFAKANSGTQAQNLPQSEWLLHPAVAYKDKFKDEKLKAQLAYAKPGYWIGFQMNWMGDGIEGCVRDAGSQRSVVEMSFADPAQEGTTRHSGRYAIVSVTEDANSTGFDLDRVRDGKGGRLIPVAPIPPPQVVSVKQGKDGRLLVTVKLEDPVSYSEGGLNQPVNLIAGTQVYYVAGKEPSSSDPKGYKPAADPGNPDKELGLVPVGTKQVELALPKADEPLWLVTRIQYADPTATLLSSAVSSHVRAEAGAGGSRERGTRQGAP